VILVIYGFAKNGLRALKVSFSLMFKGLLLSRLSPDYPGWLIYETTKGSNRSHIFGRLTVFRFQVEKVLLVRFIHPYFGEDTREVRELVTNRMLMLFLDGCKRWTVEERFRIA
jgi:hypothetical protein